MRILQVIDSLEAGGAERMAVNYANALVPRIEFSALCATRAEGPLRDELDPNAGYVFLRRKSTLDWNAVRRLRHFCVQNQIDIVHAHSSSYFIALLTRLLLPRLRVVWHDHNGMSEFLDRRPDTALKLASYFFGGIIVVNGLLKQWAGSVLHCRNTIYLPNFPENYQTESVNPVDLKGVDSKRILCLANLRPQKNHQMLLDVAARVKMKHPNWTFHLVGKDFGDPYSQAIKNRILAENLQENVFLYGSIKDTAGVISNCDIAVITSVSEGLPVSVLECGLHARPLVVTNVGQLSSVIENERTGFIVDSGDAGAFSGKVIRLIEDEDLRTSLGSALQNEIQQNYSAPAVMSQYMDWLQKILNG